MAALLLVLLLALNYAISAWDGYAAGLSWRESKLVGGFARLLAWSALVMSSCGFVSVYGILLGLLAYATGALNEVATRGLFSIIYVVIIFPILGAGLVIWADSLIQAWRRRDAVSIATAGWNTFAMADNTIDAISSVPSAFSAIGDLFSSATDSDDSDGDNLAGVVGLFVIAVILAIAFALSASLTYLFFRKGVRASLGRVRGISLQKSAA